MIASCRRTVFPQRHRGGSGGASVDMSGMVMAGLFVLYQPFFSRESGQIVSSTHDGEHRYA